MIGAFVIGAVIVSLQSVQWKISTSINPFYRSPALHITGLDPESTAAVYPSQWTVVGGVISTLEYKGYLVLGRAQVIHPGSPDWRSQGIVFTNTPEGSIMVQRLEGAVYQSKEAAEKHGLELGKKWIDENPNKGVG